MATRSEILQRNQAAIRRLLMEHDVAPNIAELVLQGVFDSLPRRTWERLEDPDKVLLERVREACLQVEDIRLQAARFVDQHRALRLRAALKIQ
jgi:hypothetical protein